MQVPGSASSYSVGAHSYTMGEKVTQSASLYSMSSGSSCASGRTSQEKLEANKKFDDVVLTAGYSSASRASNVSSPSSNGVDIKQNHNHNCSTNGCLGAIPRNPSFSSSHHFRGHRSHSFRVSCMNELCPAAALTEFLIRLCRIGFQTCQIDCHP